MSWQCACGIENRDSSTTCGGCGWTKEQLKRYYEEEQKKSPKKKPGFFTLLIDTAMRNAVVERAFKAGQNAEPPPQYSMTDYGQLLQEISDEAYEKGQKSILIKIGKKLAE